MVSRAHYYDIAAALEPAIAADTGDWIQLWSENPRTGTIEPNPKADTLIWNTGADIRHGGGEPIYDPDGDFIQMPPRECFVSCPGYYFTAMHELAHWTSARERLNRRFTSPMRFREEFAREEILCDLVAILLSADLHIALDHAAQADYIKGWLGEFGGDIAEFSRVVPRAAMICDYLHSLRYGNWAPWHSR